MSDKKTIRQYDVPKTINTRAFNASGFVDLTQFTGGITFKMVGPVTIQGSATGDANGNLSFTLTGTQTDVPGTYEATFRGIDGSGTPQTFPEETNLHVVIVPAL